MSNGEQNISVPIPEFVENLVKLTVKECLPKIIDEHRINCPVNDLKTDMWGNEHPGIKSDVHDLKRDMKDIKKKRSFFYDLLKPVIAALVIATIFWFMNQYAQSKTAQVDIAVKQQDNKIDK